MYENLMMSGNLAKASQRNAIMFLLPDEATLCFSSLY